MTQNLQADIEPAQQAASTLGDEQVQDARALIDHLSSALSAEENGLARSLGEPDAVSLASRETTSFARAIMRQTDQIRYLVQQVNRMDSDTEVARLRAVVIDLCGALTDVTLRMKQDTSQAAGKIKALLDAMTIIGGAPDDIDASQNSETQIPGAVAAAGRLASLEQISKEVQAAILALEDSEARGQTKIRDLSAGLIKLNENVESGRGEISGLRQKIGSADQAVAQVLTRLDAAIEAYRGEFARLQQRVGAADQTLVQGLARLDDAMEAHRGEFAGLQQRVGAADQTLVHGLARLDNTMEAHRGEFAGLQQRVGAADQTLTQGLARLDNTMEAHRGEFAGWRQQIESADRALTEVMARLTHSVEAHRGEIAGLQQRAGSTDRTLTEGLAALGEHATVLRNDLGQIHQRLGAVEGSTALHSVMQDRIDGLNRRLEELKQDSAVEFKSWRLQESERNAALTSKLELLEQKNHALAQGTEQMAARLNAAEQTIAAVVQRQKALSSVHDRVVRLLLANTDLQS